jgi:hypothetical protein
VEAEGQVVGREPQRLAQGMERFVAVGHREFLGGVRLAAWQIENRRHGYDKAGGGAVKAGAARAPRSCVLPHIRRRPVPPFRALTGFTDWQ